MLAAALAAAGATARGEDAADLILTHGTFYPVAHPSAAPATVAGSLAVRGGRIVYLGDDAGAAAFRGPATAVIDLAGRTVTPGLIDAHSHLASLGEALTHVDLVGAASYEEVVRRVAAAAAALPPGAWVLRPRLGPEPVAGPALPQPRAAVGGGARPAGLARADRRPRGTVERPGDGAAGDHRRHPRSDRRPPPPRRRRSVPAASSSTTPWTLSRQRCRRPRRRSWPSASASPPLTAWRSG